ncbi:hypothetical protein ACRAWD_30065 [Caulobacter segnis]
MDRHVDTATYKCTGPSGAPFQSSHPGLFLDRRGDGSQRQHRDGCRPGPARPIRRSWRRRRRIRALPGYRFRAAQRPRHGRRSWNARSIASPVKRDDLYTADGQYDVGFGEVYGEFLGHERKSSQTNIQQLFPIIAPGSAVQRQPIQLRGRLVERSGLRRSGVGSRSEQPRRTGVLYAPQALVLTPFKHTQDVTVYRGVLGLRGPVRRERRFPERLAVGCGYGSFSKNRGSTA